MTRRSLVRISLPLKVRRGFSFLDMKLLDSLNVFLSFELSTAAHQSKYRGEDLENNCKQREGEISLDHLSQADPTQYFALSLSSKTNYLCAFYPFYRSGAEFVHERSPRSPSIPEKNNGRPQLLYDSE
jgi:hypothetical protein